LGYDEELVAPRLRAELIPGGAKRDLSAVQAKRLLATARPRTSTGKRIRRIAAVEIADLVAVDGKLKAIKKELREAVQARGSHLMDLFGVGPAGAARILGDVGDVARSAPTSAHRQLAVHMTEGNQKRETSDLLIPDSTAIALTRSSTLRVETP
jgi:transposase